jgi:hypothetical protein
VRVHNFLEREGVETLPVRRLGRFDPRDGLGGGELSQERESV